jgi:hypothetical protein
MVSRRRTALVLSALVIASTAGCVSDLNVTVRKDTKDAASETSAPGEGSGGTTPGSGGSGALSGKGGTAGAGAGGIVASDGGASESSGGKGTGGALRDAALDSEDGNNNGSGGSAGDASSGGSAGKGGVGGAPSGGTTATGGAGGRGAGGTGAGGAAGNGGAAPECTPMMAKCLNNGVRTCDPAGKWGNPVACVNQTCVSGACQGTCAPMAPGCSNSNAVVTCDANGNPGNAPCVDKACVGGVCTGSCAPGVFLCTNLIGQKCSSTGSYISNGSTVVCSCYEPGRFVSAGTNLVRDTKTGLIWDVAMRAPAQWTVASTTCDNLGMRLPTFGEWRGVTLVGDSNTGTATCQKGTFPFDQAAMPTTNTDVGNGMLWTSQVEPGFSGYVYVAYLMGAAPTWIVNESDEKTTMSHPYRCVK